MNKACAKPRLQAGEVSAQRFSRRAQLTASSRDTACVDDCHEYLEPLGALDHAASVSKVTR